MTIAQIESELAQQQAIHAAARQMVETLEAAAKAVAKLGGDADQARERILELVTE